MLAVRKPSSQRNQCSPPFEKPFTVEVAVKLAISIAFHTPNTIFTTTMIIAPYYIRLPPPLGHYHHEHHQSPMSAGTLPYQGDNHGNPKIGTRCIKTSNSGKLRNVRKVSKLHRMIV